MVLFFESSSVQPPIKIYMGKDKFENEDLIANGFEEDVWFHVDNLSSAHVYMRLHEGMSWDNIPQNALIDCAQLVKANSIQGNKRDNVTIIYTPWSNLKKSGDMEVGAVAFHHDKRVRKVHVQTRENPIVNRLNKTKVEKEVDFIAEKVAYQKRKGQTKKRDAINRKHEEDEQKRKMLEEKEAKSYDNLWSEEDYHQPQQRGMEMEEDFM